MLILELHYASNLIHIAQAQLMMVNVVGNITILTLFFSWPSGILSHGYAIFYLTSSLLLYT